MMLQRWNLGFLASGRGSNMQAVIDAWKAGRLRARPALVISNNSGSEALARARREGIPCCHLSSLTHPGPGELDRAILGALEQHGVDLVILAGYMRKLGPETLRRYRGRVLNIHPALLPRFGGQGMHGARVHAAVLAAGVAETGVTIHLVDEEYDHGPIVAQRRVKVLPGDTVESLAARVLEHEHTFLVETLQTMVAGTMTLPSME